MSVFSKPKKFICKKCNDTGEVSVIRIEENVIDSITKEPPPPLHPNPIYQEFCDCRLGELLAQKAKVVR